MLLNGGEAHRVRVGEAGDREVGVHAAAPQDVAAGRIGERLEDGVGLLRRSFYNHLVVDYQTISRPADTGAGTTRPSPVTR